MDKRAFIASALSRMMPNSTISQLVFTAKVVSVEGLTCTIDYDGFVLSDVRLIPTTSVEGNRVLLIPANDTYVLVISESGDLSNLWVARIDTAEKVEIVCGDISVEVSKEGVILNGGSLGGMVKVKEVTTKLNTLEMSLNELKTVFEAWQAIPNDGGAALKAAITQWAGQPITQTKVGDLENAKVKQ